ncbi:YraN family protein [Shimia sp. R10_1]|uniref:YraN family protein n=1 Tax=Shimia sp. R10_1 TaxID=2821095 RepID=UPI001ADC857A|nr:YraN family protein [Shimia sp. R10_1]MBO9474642.1 YraN family protein [Shimia sp. R10_1]
MGDKRRADTGLNNYLAGAAAEEVVERHYLDLGLRLARRRWRSKAGEIDLIFHDGETLVFVEVKKSNSIEAAMARLLPRQVARLRFAAEDFAGRAPQGLLTEMRFDLALVDDQGSVHILENALC